MEPDVCPHCGKDLHYEGEDQGDIFSRVIGAEIRGVYDGILFWFCPYCDCAWHRFEDDHMKAKAQPFIDQHNKTTLVRRG